VLLIHIIFTLLTSSFWPYLAYPFLLLALCSPLGLSGHISSGLRHHPVLYSLSGPIPTSHSTIHYRYLIHAHPSCPPTLCESPLCVWLSFRSRWSHVTSPRLALMPGHQYLMSLCFSIHFHSSLCTYDSTCSLIPCLDFTLFLSYFYSLFGMLL
jgi:hypothetical protein